MVESFAYNNHVQVQVKPRKRSFSRVLAELRNKDSTSTARDKNAAPPVTPRKDLTAERLSKEEKDRPMVRISDEYDQVGSCGHGLNLVVRHGPAGSAEILPYLEVITDETKEDLIREEKKHEDGENYQNVWKDDGLYQNVTDPIKRKFKGSSKTKVFRTGSSPSPRTKPTAISVKRVPAPGKQHSQAR